MQEKDISQNDRDRERQSKAAVHSETVCLLIENPHHQVPERDVKNDEQGELNILIADHGGLRMCVNTDIVNLSYAGRKPSVYQTITVKPLSSDMGI